MAILTCAHQLAPLWCLGMFWYLLGAWSSATTVSLAVPTVPTNLVTQHGYGVYIHQQNFVEINLLKFGNSTNSWVAYCWRVRLLIAMHDDVIKWKHFPRYWPYVRGTTGNPITKASDGELWCFVWSTPKHTVEQTIEAPVIWDTTALIMKSL